MKFMFFLFLLLPLAVHSMDVTDIIKKANHNSYYRGKDGRAKVRMTIKDAQNRIRKRSFIILRKNTDKKGIDGNQKFYVYFKRPSDVKKMAFLVWKNVKKDDDRWMYFPSLDLVKRIAGSDKRTSFVGSDFFYEDVSGRNINSDVHELKEQNKTYYILISTPKDKKSVEFSYYKTWIHKQSYLPIKTEYYKSAKKQPYRTYNVLKVNNIQNKPTVTEAVMKDVEKKTQTTITYKKVEYDVGLDDGLFTERYLRNPPTKEMKF